MGRTVCAGASSSVSAVVKGSMILSLGSADRCSRVVREESKWREEDVLMNGSFYRVGQLFMLVCLSPGPQIASNEYFAPVFEPWL